MAFKFALIATLCVAQAFAFNPMGKFQKKLCNPAAELAQEIPREFEEAMQEMDDIRDTVSAAAMESYVQGTDPQVIIACFKQQRGAYMKLGQQISDKVRKASKEIAAELGEKYQKYAEKAAAPMKNISMTMRLLPQKMWMHIKDKEFGKALEVMRESRKIVEENSRILAQIMREMAEEVPEAAKKAEKMAREIREFARNGRKQIGDAFQKCVEAGGPQHPVEDEDTEVDAEIEDAPEQ